MDRGLLQLGIRPPTFDYVADERRMFGLVSAGWGEAFNYMWLVFLNSPEHMERLKRKLETAFDQLDHSRLWGVDCKLSHRGVFFTTHPGDRCDVYSDLKGMECQRLSNHNIDTPAQTFALWLMATIWFAEVANLLYYQESLEGMLASHPSSSFLAELEYRWRFGSDGPPPSTELQKITLPDDNNAYYAFGDGMGDTRDKISREVSSLFEIYEIATQVVPVSSYRKLPLLVPFRPVKQKENENEPE